VIKIGAGVADAVPEALIRDLRPMVKSIRATLPAIAERGLGSKSDAKAAVRALGEALQREWTDEKVETIALQRGGQVLRGADRDWRPILAKLREADRPPDGTKMLERWIGQSAKRITSIRDEVPVGLERDLYYAIEHDWTPTQLAHVWKSRPISLEWGTLEGRTKVIAHQQLRSLRVEVQRERSKSVGVKQMQWQHNTLVNFRPEHKALDGTVWDWDSPPSVGLPGIEPNCRCEAISIVTDELLEALGITGVSGLIEGFGREGRRAA
jgi:SPP1 gp7 family putative phage head morphogenesis protein